MRLSEHPLWLVGFRPFFALACLSGMSLPLVWALMFTGVLTPPPSPLTPNQWHAHEMFFGFGWAVLGGFLLTSTKNWVNIRGYHGTPLVVLAAAWLIERLGIWYAGHLPALLFAVASNLFLGVIVLMLKHGMISPRRAAAMMGEDFDEILAEIEEDKSKPDINQYQWRALQIHIFPSGWFAQADTAYWQDTLSSRNRFDTRVSLGKQISARTRLQGEVKKLSGDVANDWAISVAYAVKL